MSELAKGDRVEVTLQLGWAKDRFARGYITDLWVDGGIDHADLYEVTFDKDRPVPYVAMPKANFTKRVLRRLSVLELIAEAAI